MKKKSRIRTIGPGYEYILYIYDSSRIVGIRKKRRNSEKKGKNERGEKERTKKGARQGEGSLIINKDPDPRFL